MSRWKGLGSLETNEEHRFVKRRAYSTAFLLSVALHGLLAALLAAVAIRERPLPFEGAGVELLQLQRTPKPRPIRKRRPVLPQRVPDVLPRAEPTTQWTVPITTASVPVTTAVRLPAQAGGIPAETPPTIPPRPTVPMRADGPSPRIPIQPEVGSVRIAAAPADLAPDEPLPGLSSFLLRDAISSVQVALPTPEYWETIQKRIVQQRRYPRFAQEQGIAGTVVVRFVLRRDGTLESVQVVRSSGYRILDKEAIATIRRAAPFPPFPPGQSGERVAVEVPIVYRLTDSNR